MGVQVPPRTPATGPEPTGSGPSAVPAHAGRHGTPGASPSRAPRPGSCDQAPLVLGGVRDGPRAAPLHQTAQRGGRSGVHLLGAGPAPPGGTPCPSAAAGRTARAPLHLREHRVERPPVGVPREVHGHRVPPMARAQPQVVSRDRAHLEDLQRHRRRARPGRAPPRTPRPRARAPGSTPTAAPPPRSA